MCIVLSWALFVVHGVVWFRVGTLYQFFSLFLLLRFFCFEKRVIVSGFYWEGKRVEEGRGCEGDRVVSSSRGTSESSNPGRWGLGGYNGIWEEGGGYTVGGIFSVRFRYFWLTLHYPCS